MIAQRFKRFFDTDPTLQRLAAKITELQRLEKLWQAAVPPELASHSAPCELHGGCLSAIASDGLTASKLQQMAPTIVKMLQNHGFEGTNLSVRVGIPRVERTIAPAVARSIGGAGRAAISEAADGLAEGPLKKALLRLLG